jgi:Flp pilus assembly protein TadD
LPNAYLPLKTPVLKSIHPFASVGLALAVLVLGVDRRIRREDTSLGICMSDKETTMLVRFLGACAVVSVLCGCAAPGVVASLPESNVWQDVVFNYRADLVSESPKDLFAIDPAMLGELGTNKSRIISGERRLDALLAMLYTRQGIRLAYSSGHSTGAMQTWKDKQGDCLSLTILTYSVAKALGLNAVMQQVEVPPIFDRRDEADYVSHHVNVLIPTRATILFDDRPFEPGAIVVDFQPQFGARNRGTSLSESQIVARFYNNRGSEYMAQKRDDFAYAYYKAAIAFDVNYGPAYSNLAQLYYRRGLANSAEKLLWHAVALDKVSDVPVRNLHTLLMAQGRDQEALQVSVMMERLKEQDPYHWLSTGLDALQNDRVRSAISALEKAQALAIGFREIHYHLAIAYARNGDRDKAAKQIAALDAINHNDPGIALLNKKLQGMSAKSTFF